MTNTGRREDLALEPGHGWGGLFAHNINSLRRDFEVIAIARLLLVMSSSIVLWIEEPLERFSAENTIPILYFLLALAFLWSTSDWVGSRVRVAVHLFDIVFTISMMFIAETATFLFIVLSMFCLLSAAAQWNWRTVLLTGLSLTLVYLMAQQLGYVSGERLVVRVLFLCSGTGLIAWGAQARELHRSRLTKLANWGTGRLDGTKETMRSMLRQAAEILGAEAVLIIWRERESTQWQEAEFDRWKDELKLRSSSGRFIREVPEQMKQRTFLLPAAPSSTAVATSDRAGENVILPRVFEFASDGASIANAPFAGSLCEGRIYVVGRGRWRLETTSLLELVGSQVLARLEGRSIREKQAAFAAEAEHLRWARDLHDGVLQSMTAARMRLHLADLARTDEELKAQIRAAGTLLQEEQQRLRSAIESGKGMLTSSSETNSSEALGEVIRKVAKHWSVSVDLDITTNGSTLPESLFWDLSLLVSEAIANAVRHGDGHLVRVSIVVESDSINMEFSNSVRPGLTILNKVRPRSLSSRIEDLGGDLMFEIGTELAVLKMIVPLHE